MKELLEKIIEALDISVDGINELKERVHKLEVDNAALRFALGYRDE